MNLFYDPMKNGVDFLTDTGDNTIPLEVSIGKKNKKQITKAINHYKSDHGIIISNTTARIKKEDNIIYIPLMSIP
jgi:predicted AAA+ superfamily ATPase